VADPPWRYRRTKGITTKGFHPSTAEAQYPTMTLEQIAALPVAALAAPDAHLYMWVTNPILCEQRSHGGPSPVQIVREWGFEPITLLTWVKGENGAGMGFYWRGDTEHVIFAVRGDLPIPAAMRQSNVFRGKRGRHSEKPDVFMDRVEQVSPAPRLEMFSRRARFSWDTWGHEALGTVEMAS
jgi:N6-adenosine-specific RNA methylase IME4